MKLYHIATIFTGIHDELRYATDWRGAHIMVGQDRVPVYIMPADHPEFWISTVAPSPTYWGWVERDPSVEAGILINIAPLVGIEMETSRDVMVVYVNVPSRRVDVGTAHAFKCEGGQALLEVRLGDVFSAVARDGTSSAYQCVSDAGWPTVVRIETRSAA